MCIGRSDNCAFEDVLSSACAGETPAAQPMGRRRYVANNILADPARDSGHAMGAGMRSEMAHLRTRVEKEGMNYEGFNIAVHENGTQRGADFSLNNATID
jgi:hypothetical protein